VIGFAHIELARGVLPGFLRQGGAARERSGAANATNIPFVAANRFRTSC
jgi:hypothetical protein